jgi:hypothetical protein
MMHPYVINTYRSIIPVKALFDPALQIEPVSGPQSAQIRIGFYWIRIRTQQQ